ncbi:TlyA family RNA methyltransferase [Defluviitalea saccharophila]|uniref:TlyA family RNA methyltransferase n=1 Tax=Defluviitalea saccharophila TaxID=879970 RepID=A0ABZ2Y4Y6_9FIRM|nr:TlyA family RNA methyltransferase [Candidatus Epulonipiscium sp.]
MTNKERLDILLVKRGFFESREKAKASIMAGQIIVNGIKEVKAGVQVDENANIEVKEVMKYVSRGGYKLEKAMEAFSIDLENKIALDVGASTGGFTDCMLQNGAKKVYAIDVGYGQFAWKLRQDERVVCMEKTNIRYVTKDDLAELGDFASIDVSFISLTKVLVPVKNLLTDCGEIVCLIKPQFEAGREKVGKKGVVRDPKVHEEVILNVIHYGIEENLYLRGLSYSPIKGPEGNIEYLAYFSKQSIEDNNLNIELLIQKTVEEAHNELN